MISLPTYLLVGLPAHLALGTNKMGSMFGTAMATWRFSRNGFINWKKCIFFIAAALLGSVSGSNLALHVREGVVEKMLLIVLPIVAFYVFRNRDMGDDSKAGTLPERTSFIIALLTSLVVGVWDGFYGPGTGTFLILLLTGAAKMTMKEAAGTTKAINLSSNCAAFVTFLINGKVLILLGLTAALFSIAGNYIGSGMVMHDSRKIVRPVILLVLIVLFVKIVLGR